MKPPRVTLTGHKSQPMQMCPSVEAVKTRVPIRGVLPFWEITMSWNVAERQHNDCVHSLFSLRDFHRATTYLPHRPKPLDKQTGLSHTPSLWVLSVQCWGVSSTVPTAVTIMGPNIRSPDLQSPVIKGCSLGSSCKNQGIRHTCKQALLPGDNGVHQRFSKGIM